jgi:hypothetical protein
MPDTLRIGVRRMHDVISLSVDVAIMEWVLANKK